MGAQGYVEGLIVLQTEVSITSLPPPLPDVRTDKDTFTEGDSYLALGRGVKRLPPGSVISLPLPQNNHCTTVPCWGWCLWSSAEIMRVSVVRPFPDFPSLSSNQWTLSLLYRVPSSSPLPFLCAHLPTCLCVSLFPAPHLLFNNTQPLTPAQLDFSIWAFPLQLLQTVPSKQLRFSLRNYLDNLSFCPSDFSVAVLTVLQVCCGS